MSSPKLSEVYGHEEEIVAAIEDWVNGDLELGRMTAHSGRCIEQAGRTLRNRIDRVWLDLDEDDPRQKITKRIKQISPVASGWTFHYLVEDKDGTFSVASTPVMGQALVERTFWDGTVTDDIEFVIFHEDDLMTFSDAISWFTMGSNTYPLEICAPDYNLKLEHLETEIAAYKDKKQEQKEERAARRAARQQEVA
jgi:hypothetical protein